MRILQQRLRRFSDKLRWIDRLLYVNLLASSSNAIQMSFDMFILQVTFSITINNKQQS